MSLSMEETTAGAAEETTMNNLHQMVVVINTASMYCNAVDFRLLTCIAITRSPPNTLNLQTPTVTAGTSLRARAVKALVQTAKSAVTTLPGTAAALLSETPRYQHK